jgi:hypothetical protein
MNETTRTALTSFINAAQAQIDAHMERKFPTLSRHILVEDIGRRYVRIWNRCEGETGRGYAYCFVDMTNGDILKPESRKKPAKHARGNIFTLQNVSDAVGVYGTNYLR